MENKVKIFCEQLRRLDPEESDGLIGDLYDIVEPIEDEKDIELTFEPIFSFFEKYPDADVGNPGPLVHLLESHYPKYMDLLLESIKKRANYMGVIMLSRVLNGELSPNSRDEYMKLLKTVANSDLEDEITKETAMEIYQFQLEKARLKKR